MNLCRTIVCLAVLTLAFGAGQAFAQDGAGERITLQLKWKHQFQFAGYYAAIAKGFYRDAGLDVTLRELGAGEAVIPRVVSGDAEFGIASSDLIVHFARGEAIVALAPIFQHSPLILLVDGRTGVTNLHELADRPIALEPHSDELFAYFQTEGVARGKLEIVQHGFDPSMLISGEITAISAYATDEPFLLESAGVPYLTFTPRAAGIDFYGDTLFTSRELIEKRPELVRDFTNASLQGWTYAFAHPDEIIDLILAEYSTRHSREHLQFEAGVTRRLVQPELVEVGYTNPGRWRHIASTYASLGMMPADVALEEFIYDREPASGIGAALVALGGSLVVTCIVLAIAIYLYRLNRIVHRQKDELEKALVDIKVLRGIIPICSYCKKIQNDQGAWQQMEHYISTHTDADFSHGMCADCYQMMVAKEGLDIDVRPDS